jgi:hypothetical protein
MHLNPQHPNILSDMQAAANGRRLHDPFAKRHLLPRKTYPYASVRQVKRQREQSNWRAFNANFPQNTKPSYIRLQRRLLKAETQG